MKLLFDAAKTTETVGGAALDNTFRIVLIVMLVGCAAYALYSAIRLRVTCELVDNKFIYPGNCKPADCLDALGFIDYIFPRCVIFSVVMLVLAVVYTLLSYVVKLSGLIYFDLAMIVLPVLAFVWFMYVQRKAAREFWGACNRRSSFSTATPRTPAI